MNQGARRLLLAGTAGLLVAASLGSPAGSGTARADVTPTPAPTDSVSASTDPTPTSTDPTATATASTSVDPTPSGSTSSSSSAPATPSTPATVATPAPAPSPSDTYLPPNDGVNPDVGQVDEYLALTAQRDTLAVRVAPLTTAYTSAHATVVWFDAQRPSVALATAVAQIKVEQTQGSTDDVVRDLYQQGDAGLGAIAQAISGGPESFLDNLDNAQMERSTAYGVVNDAITARAEFALAQATMQAFDLRHNLAVDAELKAKAALDAANAELASLDARLASLSIVPPQVAIGPDGCPTVDIPGTLRDGSDLIGAAKLCQSAVRQAATPQAALAITWAFQHLGAAYACGGAGRMLPYRADCSSFVSRAYHEGAGIGTAGATWAPSTRDMVPWDGVRLDPHYAYVAPAALRPGDLVLYNSCPQGGCPYRHVVMYLGSPDGGKTQWMAHTNACGDVAKVARFWGFPTTGEPFLVARRVIALPGETVVVPTVATARSTANLAQRLGAAAATRAAAASR